MNRAERVWRTLPAEAKHVLADLVNADDFCGVIPASVVERLVETGRFSLEGVMLELLPLAKAYALPPISNFYVGAVAQGQSGNLYLGANMEFPGQSLSATVHAEQSAVLHAWLHGEEGVTAIAVNGIPCGHCRQFLTELHSAPDLRILTPQTGIVALAEMLPHAFGPASLGNETRWMQPMEHKLHLAAPSVERVTLAALEMAKRSYAPYSRGYSGVALGLETGQIIAAPYAENVAFNPSLSPLQGALIHLHLLGCSPAQIEQAVLVEVADALCSQQVASRELLRRVAGLELEVAYAVRGLA